MMKQMSDIEASFVDVCEELECENDNEAALQAVAALKDRIRQLEEALRPFAEEAGRYDPVENDDDAYLWDTSVTLGQLRAARRALGESYDIQSTD